jgi:hypothetical protein
MRTERLEVTKVINMSGKNKSVVVIKKEYWKE